MSVKNVKVDHNKEINQFRAFVDNDKAFLNYRKKGKNTLECYETFVPVEERRQGIAAQLTKEALNYAKQNNLRVDPSCPYVKSYIDNHQEFKNLEVNS